MPPGVEGDNIPPPRQGAGADRLLLVVRGAKAPVVGRGARQPFVGSGGKASRSGVQGAGTPSGPGCRGGNIPLLVGVPQGGTKARLGLGMQRGRSDPCQAGTVRFLCGRLVRTWLASPVISITWKWGGCRMRRQRLCSDCSGRSTG